MLMMKKCCSFDVRIGTFMVGCLGLIDSIFSIAICLGGSDYIDEKGSNYLHDVYTKGRPYVVFLIVGNSIVSFVLNVFIMCAAYKNKNRMLVPWLITNCILIILTFLIYFVAVILFFVYNLFIIGITLFFVGIPIIAIRVYFWLCVKSYHQNLVEEEERIVQPQEQVKFIPNRLV